MKRIVLLLAISLSIAKAYGQKDYYSQSLYWIRYQNQLFFSPTLFWTNEVDNRRFFNPDVQSQFIAHSHLHKKIKNFDGAIGCSYSVAYAAVPERGYKQGRHEIRPFIEGNYDFPFKKFTIQNRLRIDNRFFQEDLDKSVFEESEYVTRFRYRLQVRVPVKRNENNTPTITLRVADEIMVNSKENFYDQNRFYVSSDFLLSKSVTLETGYIYIDQHAYGREEYYARNVFRVSVFHKINLH